jgi:tetratricopeptide (TPR) repeat protein
MTRPEKRFAVLIALLTFAFAAAGQQHKQSRTPAPATSPKQAPVPPYPYMEAVHQNDLGIELMDRGQFADAFAKFQTACVMDVESDVGCQNAGIALVSMENYDDARKMLSKSAERNPQYARAWFSLGILEKMQGHPDAAIADFEKVAAIDQGDADTQCLIGLLYLDQKQYANAIGAFTKAITLDPLLASAELGLAQAKQQTGAIGESLAHLKRLEDMSANNTGRTVDFAYGKAGELSKAEKIVPPEPQSSAASPSP